MPGPKRNEQLKGYNTRSKKRTPTPTCSRPKLQLARFKSVSGRVLSGSQNLKNKRRRRQRRRRKRRKNGSL